MLLTSTKLCIFNEPLVQYASGKGTVFTAVLEEASKKSLSRTQSSSISRAFRNWKTDRKGI